MKPLPYILLLVPILAGGGLWWWMRAADRPNRSPTPVDARPRARSPEQRLGEALRDTDRGRRSARFATIWSEMTADEAAELAPQLLANETGSPFQNDWLEFLLLWGGLDPHAALEFTDENAGTLADDWRRAIARGWAGVDPQAAAQWWLTAATTDREGLGSTIVGIWAIGDWKAAAAWVSDRVPPEEQPGLTNAIAYQIVQNQPDTGKALLEAHRERGTPPTALETGLFNNFSRAMPLDWLSSFKELFPVSPVLLERLALETRTPNLEIGAPDPKAKEWFLWLVNQYNPPVLDYMRTSRNEMAQTQLFKHWVADDAEAASGWLAVQPPSPGRDGFASTLIGSIIVEDTDAASEWLATLSPGSRRIFFVNWTVANPHRIDAAIETLMKRDGFDPRRHPSEIHRELERPQAP